MKKIWKFRDIISKCNFKFKNLYFLEALAEDNFSKTYLYQSQEKEKTHSKNSFYIFSVFFIFWEMELSSLKIENFLIFYQKKFF